MSAHPTTNDGAGNTIVLHIESNATTLRSQRPDGSRAPGEVTIPWGPANLQKRWMTSDPPAPDSLTNALGAIDDYLVDFDRDVDQYTTSVVVNGATAAAIGRLEQGIDSLDGPLVIERRDLEEVFRLVANETIDERAENPGLVVSGDEDAAATIVAGICIVLAPARRYRCDTIELRP